MVELQTVTKLEAAEGQLFAALELYFRNRHPIAVHALSAGAQEILSDLAGADGERSTLLDTLLQAVRPERRGEVATALRKPQNFLKHGDRDPDEVLSFWPRQAEFILLSACEALVRRNPGVNLLIRVYPWWFRAWNPDLFEPAELPAEQATAFSDLRETPRDLVWEAYSVLEDEGSV